MSKYPPNATSIERLAWYRDNDIQRGWILCELLNQLEENFHWDVTFAPEDESH